MKKQTKILITAVATVLVVLSVCLFVGKNSSESSEPMTAADVSVAATSIEGQETGDETVLPEIQSTETGESSEGNQEAVTEGETAKEETSKEEAERTGENTVTETEVEPSSVPEQQEPAVGNGSGHNRASTETGNETTSGNTEESSSESDREIYSSEYGIYGDTGKKKYYPCNEEKYSIVVGSVCNPDTFSEKYADVFYDEVLALSERFRREHPFSEGSILKPYYPDIDAIYWFTGNFDKRYIVLEAYDTSHKGKFFLIEFTITDNYELDTVSIRELADDEVGE